MTGYASLIASESGGDWRARNNVPGSGGSGHFGRLQFSRGRLQDAMTAGIIPFGTTPEQFMADPAMQQRVEQWHFSDIDRFIDSNGLGQYVGQVINGTPITREGMRAVAHLGGSGGLQRFLTSGGSYNPSDAYGTSLLDYLGRHQGGDSVATRGQSAPMANPGVLAALTGQQAAPQAAPSIWDRAPFGLSDPDRRARLAVALEGMTLNPNAALMRGLQDDIQQRREMAATERSRNATAEWLRANGREDLAAVVEAGGLQGGQAMGLVMEAQDRARAESAPPAAIRAATAWADELGLQGEERNAYMRQAAGLAPASPDWQIQEFGGALYRVSPDTGQTQLLVQANGQPDPEAMGVLRREWNNLPVVRTFVDQASAFTRIQESAAAPSAAGDLSLIFSYMRLLDPASTVREGEFATAQQAAGVPEQVRTMYNRLLSGERLGPEQRSDFVDRATRLYRAAEGIYDGVRSQYSGIVERAGMPLEDVLPDYRVQIRDMAASATAPAFGDMSMVDLLQVDPTSLDEAGLRAWNERYDEIERQSQPQRGPQR